MRQSPLTALLTALLPFVHHHRYGLHSFVLFPKIPDALKTNFGEESYNPVGLVPRAVAMIKARFPQAVVCTDVALDPYSSEVTAIGLNAHKCC